MVGVVSRTEAEWSVCGGVSKEWRQCVCVEGRWGGGRWSQKQQLYVRELTPINL